MFKVCMLENSLYLMLRVSQRLNNEYKPCTCTFGMSSIKQIYSQRKVYWAHVNVNKITTIVRFFIVL